MLRDLLKELVEAHGVTGFEHEAAKVVEKYFLPYSDEIKIDKMGSLSAIKKGKAQSPKRIMLAAHMDEIGLMVKKIDDKGFIQFTNVGGVDQRTLLTQEVIIHGKKDLFGVIGSKPPHILEASERKKAVKMEDMLIDVGLSKEDVEKYISIGDPITIRRKLMNLQNDMVAGKALDDRAGVAVMYECLKELKNMHHDCDVYAVATVQEEVGYRGAIPATFEISPHIGIAIDVGFGSTPELPKDETSDLGKGPCIGFGANIHPKVYERLVKVAKEYNIPYQQDIYPGATGTDAWGMQITRGGVSTGLISIPLRYMHTSVETVQINDIKNAGKLLAYFIVSLNGEDLEGMLCY
ncbi:M42 family metallopeptidase [Lutispora sp.]|uniref:M42 family metallopeptidase n=1 Tax=Lutispora sp. TaxID=2828727 RepID=UPI0035617660